MPFIPTGRPRRFDTAPGIRDVFRSSNVFANFQPVALHNAPSDVGATVSFAKIPEVSFVLEAGDMDGVTEETTATLFASKGGTLDNAVNTGFLGTLTTATTTLEVLDANTTTTVDSTVPPNLSSTKVDCSRFAQFNQNNIPYDTLMLTDKTPLSAFTTKAALWANQPSPRGPDAIHPKNNGVGDNKYLKDQDYYRNGVTAGRITVPEILCNLANLAKNVYEPIKDKYPAVVVTNSFRQNPPGGANIQAQHGLGMALDLQFPGVPASSYYDIAAWIRDNVPFDQLLQEKSGDVIWIHVSHYSGRGYQVPTGSKVANLIIAGKNSQFIPGLSRLG